MSEKMHHDSDIPSGPDQSRSADDRDRWKADRRTVRGAAGCIGGALLGLMLILLGFWKTLLVVACACAGFFVCAVEDKQQWLKDLINRLFPPRDA